MALNKKTYKGTGIAEGWMETSKRRREGKGRAKMDRWSSQGKVKGGLGERGGASLQLGSIGRRSHIILVLPSEPQVIAPLPRGGGARREGPIELPLRGHCHDAYVTPPILSLDCVRRKSGTHGFIRHEQRG